jgi:hypothetical protein
MLKPGQLAKVKRRKVLWTPNPELWPVTHPDADFELAVLQPDDVVMYIKTMQDHAYVLFKDLYGKIGLDPLFHIEAILEPIYLSKKKL